MRRPYAPQVCEAIYGILIFFTALLAAMFIKALFSFFVLMSSPYSTMSIFTEGLVALSVPLALCMIALNLYYLVKYDQFLTYYRGGQRGQRLVDHSIILLPLNVCTLACGSFLFFHLN